MPAKTSDDYSPALCIYPNGQTRKTNCVTEHLHGTDEALERLRGDYAAWVRIEDGDRVAGQWRQELDARRTTPN